MSYHTIRGNGIADAFRALWHERWRQLGLVVGIFLYGCAMAYGGAYIQRDSSLPVFNCQEDELMVWRDARNTGQCINIEEYQASIEALTVEGQS